MGSMMRWGSVALFGALSVFLMGFGFIYASVADYLSFHGAAVPEAARPAGKALYIALMTLIGGASGALGLLGMWVTVGPIRRGDMGAGAAVSIAYALAFIMAAVTAEKLAAATGAPTSWHIMGGLLATTAVALAALAGAKALSR